MSNTLYSKAGAEPALLPVRITLPDGRTRTDPATFTAEEIAEAGYVAAPAKPVPSAGQVVAWGGADWIVTDIPAAEIRAGLMAELSAYRWQVETGGITLPSGIEVSTDDRSKALINGALESLERGYYASTDFKAANGTFTLTLAEMAPLAEAVSIHVRNCFSAESAVTSQINTLTNAELAGYDVIGAFDAALAGQTGQGGV